MRTEKRHKCHLHIPLLFERGKAIGFHIRLWPEKDTRYWGFDFLPDSELDTPALNSAFANGGGAAEDFHERWQRTFRELEAEEQMSMRGECSSGTQWGSGSHLTQEAILRLVTEVYLPYWQRVIGTVRAYAPGECLHDASVKMFLRDIDGTGRKAQEEN